MKLEPSSDQYPDLYTTVSNGHTQTKERQNLPHPPLYASNLIVLLPALSGTVNVLLIGVLPYSANQDMVPNATSETGSLLPDLLHLRHFKQKPLTSVGTKASTLPTPLTTTFAYL